ncbi:uncharacterized protein LOC120703673 [Panicum virgatum]|uniref:uncharacterized protein LOC120703673 n=1 Tax=Panicum virgatum TaxID=38727 RepID=UPI0019D546E4|nr:uncharacterized protein LOC120703673 [Panicum virgatum]
MQQLMLSQPCSDMRWKESMMQLVMGAKDLKDEKIKLCLRLIDDEILRQISKKEVCDGWTDFITEWYRQLEVCDQAVRSGLMDRSELLKMSRSSSRLKGVKHGRSMKFLSTRDKMLIMHLNF